jgi:hypothetical protein
LKKAALKKAATKKALRRRTTRIQAPNHKHQIDLFFGFFGFFDLSGPFSP